MAITINGSANTVAGVAAGGINDNVVDNGTMADDAIGIAELSATGTASSSTFLRGDNSWATPTDNGKILQVVGLEMKDTESRATSSHDWGQLGDIATITMIGTGSKVIVQSWANVSSDNTTGRYGLRMAVTYPDTAGASSSDLLIVGGAEGNRQRATLAYRQNSGADFANMGFNWLLTPATSIPAGDRIQFYWSSSGEDTNTIYLNRTKANDNNNTQYRPTSGFCLMEVAA